ncbi:max dimerization protein 4-like isoform X2 [Ostrinia nubilalis]|uniref:max dimerization protein 4-like isoform X2 n=1 Tax=Ostrinia nubilalis TaxID=29057 RepID=UPI0030825025
MSIADLIQAAEFLERRDREAEHGYASSLPGCEESRSGGRRPKTKKSQGSRTTHNELEKNRRAHLRCCLEKLKDMVPLGPEASRHTTLGLLTKAKRFIKSLEDREKRHSFHKEQLAREHRYLRRRLAQLHAAPCELNARALADVLPHAHSTRADSLSSLESSSGVSTAERSPSSVSESDEVDVIGYTSNQSDSESLVSGHSGDSGVGVRARRVRARTPHAQVHHASHARARREARV